MFISIASVVLTTDQNMLTKVSNMFKKKTQQGNDLIVHLASDYTDTQEPATATKKHFLSKTNWDGL